MEDPIAVTRIWAGCPALVITAMIVPAGRELAGMAAADARPGVVKTTCRRGWLTASNSVAPVKPARIAAFALPCGVRALPLHWMSAEPVVAPESRFSD